VVEVLGVAVVDLVVDVVGVVVVVVVSGPGVYIFTFPPADEMTAGSWGSELSSSM